MPTVLNWSDKLLNTTNAIKDMHNGVTAAYGTFLGSKKSKHLQHISRPKNENAKCSTVRVHAHTKPFNIIYLFVQIIPT